MRVQDANKLAAGAAVAFKDMRSLLNYAGTVATVLPNKSMTVTTPKYPNQTSQVFNLFTDGQSEIPLTALT
jgi:hypothetical protein